MKKIKNIFFIGLPGCGKTTLIKNLVNKQPFNNLKFISSKDKIYIPKYLCKFFFFKKPLLTKYSFFKHFFFRKITEYERYSLKSKNFDFNSQKKISQLIINNSQTSVYFNDLKVLNNFLFQYNLSSDFITLFEDHFFSLVISLASINNKKIEYKILKNFKINKSTDIFIFFETDIKKTFIEYKKKNFNLRLLNAKDKNILKYFKNKSNNFLILKKYLRINKIKFYEILPQEQSFHDIKKVINFF